MQSLSNSSRRCAHVSAIFSPPGFALLKSGADKEAIVFTICYVMQRGAKAGHTVGLLVTDIKTSAEAQALGLAHASKSMYSEAFYRYGSQIYRDILYALLSQINFLGIPEIQALGRIYCVGGSVFPAIITMTWAAYQQKRNAIKLHLAFELNRMIPVQFLSTEANGSERQMLKQMLEEGVTYICDRGYVCFQSLRV